MMNVNTCVTDNTTYNMVYVISLSDLMMNVPTCVSDNSTDTMLYGRSLWQN